MLRNLISVKFFFTLLISNSFFFSQSSQQIDQAKRIIKNMDLSKSEAINAAKSRGYSQEQIDKVIKKDKSKSLSEINNFKGFNSKDEKIIQEQSNLPELKEEIIEEVLDEDKVLSIEKKSQSKRKGIAYFGYDIFKRNPELFQSATIGAIDPNYLIGPRDEIIIMLWGETQFRQALTVDREGFIFIPEIGQVFVNGLSLNLMESKLFKVFSQSYASLNPLNMAPTTFLDVSLGNLRPLSIQVLGEVAQPGYYTVKPSTTLFSALYYFNGPTTLGSLRDIQLIRGGKKIASIDFYDYLLTGKKPNDQKLQINDVVFIPRRLKTVSIQGEINREGIFELKPDESLVDLINIAGDLKMTAYLDRSQIDRIVPFNQRSELGMDRLYIDVNLNTILGSEQLFSVKNNDRVQVFSILNERQNIVEINGAVTRPGIYDLGDSLSVRSLIEKADGLLGDFYNSRAEIIRLKPNFNELLIKLDLAKVLKGDINHDIQLKSLDKVKIYQMSEMVAERYVSITGYVQNPGTYPLLENMTAYDLIFQNGGFIDEKFKKRAYLKRAALVRLNDDQITQEIIYFDLSALLKSEASEANFVLIPGDIIKIYQKDIFITKRTVSINGIVKKEGDYVFKKNMTLKDLILESDGLNQSGFTFSVEIARKDYLNDDLKKYADLYKFTINDSLNILPLTFKNKKGLLSASGDFILNPFDLVSIRANPFSNPQKKISIIGEVLNPGDYALLSSNDNILDIINRAGGLLSNAYPEGSRYSRKGEKLIVDLGSILKSSKSIFNFKVQDGDVLIIASFPNYIKVLGEVNNPGVHKFVEGRTVKFFLKAAGGLNSVGDIDNVWIEFPNGGSIEYKDKIFFNRSLLDGSSIIVGKLKEEEPFNSTEYAKELTSILANIAQVITLLILGSK